jgi:hypothetical protein
MALGLGDIGWQAAMENMQVRAAYARCCATNDSICGLGDFGNGKGLYRDRERLSFLFNRFHLVASVVVCVALHCDYANCWRKVKVLK